MTALTIAYPESEPFLVSNIFVILNCAATEAQSSWCRQLKKEFTQNGNRIREIHKRQEIDSITAGWANNQDFYTAMNEENKDALFYRLGKLTSN